MKKHFVEKHSDKADKNILYFCDLKNKFEKRKTVNELFNKIHIHHDKSLLPFKSVFFGYEVWKTHTIVETLILPAVVVI